MTVVYRDRALLLGDTLVVADLHLGKGAASSVELPIGASMDVVDRIETLVADFGPEEVVVAGDLLHSFDSVPDPARKAVESLRETVEDAGVPLVVTPGNHDTMLDSVWDGPTEDEYRIGDTVVLHGHEEPTEDAERYVVGHDHPSIVIEGKKWPCYCYGTGAYRGSDVVVLPAFNRLVEGVRLDGRNDPRGVVRSPLIPDVRQFRPIVRDEDADETLRFPPLGELERML
jgi:putative SbcD/Mre11-related phosphoesterase